MFLVRLLLAIITGYLNTFVFAQDLENNRSVDFAHDFQLKDHYQLLII